MAMTQILRHIRIIPNLHEIPPEEVDVQVKS